jgi:hypothetical protein
MAEVKTVSARKPSLMIKPNTVEMEQFLKAGYPDMSVAKAKTIIKERKENPASWPYEMLEKAEAFLAAYESSPQVTSKRPGWQRTKELV